MPLPPVFGCGALRVVTCLLPDVPLPWELERDARGLTFEVLTGCPARLRDTENSQGPRPTRKNNQLDRLG